jgi:tetraacyldisaccharide 4'-kinase
MKTPHFWNTINIFSVLLYPLSLLYYFIYKCRIFLNKNPYKSRIPIVCVGNLTVGGSGKTPTCVAIAKFLKSKNETFCFLSKGYTGHFKGILKLNKNNGKSEIVGDEPLILFNQGDTFISKNRVLGLKYINENFDYDYIIMDDGLQNPTFIKDKILLLIDGNFGFGNNLILPAGALRDKIKNIYEKIDLAIVVGNGGSIIEKLKKYNINYTSAEIIAKNNNNIDKNIEYVAFCGIGRPEKFKKTLMENSVKIRNFIVFEDHHLYTPDDFNTLYKYNRELITTEKDWVKFDDKNKKIIKFLAIEIRINEKVLDGIF